MRFDLHIHSKYSKDCTLEIEEIFRTAEGRSLDGIAITDHDTIQGGLEAQRKERDVEVIVGAEIKTDRGEIIGYFLEEEVRARTFREVVEEIHDQGGVTSLPHPFDTLRSASFEPKDEDVPFFDWVEVFNGRCLWDGFNEKARAFSRTHGLGIAAGSDAHTLEEIGVGGVIADSLQALRRNGGQEIFGQRSPIYHLLTTKVRKRLGPFGK
jgi:hypothetical protein